MPGIQAETDIGWWLQGMWKTCGQRERGPAPAPRLRRGLPTSARFRRTASKRLKNHEIAEFDAAR
jgi:hypothetical protein